MNNKTLLIRRMCVK